MRKKIAVFASGSGSDMQSIIDAVEAGDINGDVVLVVTNKLGIGAIDRAEKHGIEHRTYLAKDFGGDMVARDKAILESLISHGIDLIVLAGYLSIVTSVLIQHYEGRIINIHPSLIPKHCGKGFYGMKVHEAVIASGDTVSGCTVHFVDEGADTGKIIAQVTVPVFPSDTAESLQCRVLEQEHILLPKVVKYLCQG